MKKALIAVVGAVLMAAAGVWFVGRPVYFRHQERRAAHQAAEFLRKGDPRNASVSARRALRLNAHNLEACRVMAELNEAARAPGALDWRRRISEISPTIENKLRFAAAAMRSQGPPFTLASQTLEELATSAEEVAGYHTLAGELALKLKRPAEAAAHFETASRLEPTNELSRLNLAALRIGSTNAEVAAAARATLERLRANGELRPIALRWLVADRLQKDDLPAADRYSDITLA